MAAAGTIVVTSVAIWGGHASFADTPPNSGAVRTWNQIAIEALMNPTNAGLPGAGLAPNVGGVHLGIVQGAVYDAVNSIDGGHQPLMPGVPAASPDASLDAAVITAAHLVLDQLMHEIVPPPSTLSVVNDRIDDLRDDALGSISPGPAKDAGIAVGVAAAEAMMGSRDGDGRFDIEPFPVGDGAGEWRPVPPSNANDASAWVATTRPIVIENASDFRTAGPRNINSAAYAHEYDEVKTVGASDGERTTEQKALADFYNVNPVVLYNRTFRAVSQAEGLSLAEDARLFAMLNVGAADAFIACWDDKGSWLFWRPYTAIRNGDSDGNRHTVGVESWEPYMPTPAYPEHPSGYNCSTGAFMTAAKAFFGTDHMEFDVVRVAPPAANVTRSYVQFSDVVDDTIDARIYQGLHFRSAEVQGARLGKHVADWVNENAFQPVA